MTSTRLGPLPSMSAWKASTKWGTPGWFRLRSTFTSRSKYSTGFHPAWPRMGSCFSTT